MANMLQHSFKNKALKGRYLSYETLIKVTRTWEASLVSSLKGSSVMGLLIPTYRFGTGQKKVLMWSQMHGNESTTTKALIDFVLFLQSKDPKAIDLLGAIEFTIIPMLNPDGANAYTRVNANAVDLNRDFSALSQPESQFLMQVFNEVQPHFCFNLHDQRTIFSVGETEFPATLSFLAPAAEPSRSITASRKLSMQLIAAINKTLQLVIPGHIGRYDDTYNEQCAGDHFQSLAVPTLLFEAGHHALDYDRENTRAFVLEALLAAFQAVATNSFKEHSIDDYERIPENQKNHIDLLVQNAQLVNPDVSVEKSLAFQYEEQLEGGKITFKPKTINLEVGQTYYFHEMIDFSNSTQQEQAVVSQKIRRFIKALSN